METEAVGNKIEIVRFRSRIDFQKESWLMSERDYYTGIYKTDSNYYYRIEWSPKFDFSINNGGNNIDLKPTTRSLPFSLELEKRFFNDHLSDQNLALGLQKFVTHFIDCVEHIHLEIGVLNFMLDGRPIFYQDPLITADWRLLSYPKQDIEYEDIFREYALMDDTGHYDCVCGEAADLDSLELPWRFLMDSIVNYKAGRFKGSIIFACSAIEVKITPEIREWMIKNTYSGSDEYVDKAIIEMGNPIKFEMYFHLHRKEMSEILTDPKTKLLLDKLKWLNNKRNHVVHRGEEVTAEEAKKAIRTAGILLRIFWANFRYEFFKSQGIVLEDFISNIKDVEI